MTGLAAKGVLKTGDTSAILDHNIVAFEQGLLLVNLRDRSTPPFPAYATAMSFALFGKNAWAARLPFALCGFLTVGLMLFWAMKEKVKPSTLILLGLAILGNVSLFLFSRQCRYYGAAILCSTAIAYLYANWKGKRGQLASMVLFSLVLFASNYMIFIALYACLAVDYFSWGRKNRALAPSEWLLLLVPQFLVGGLILWIWNPLATGNKANLMSITFAEKLKSIPAFLRDLNVCEFGIVLLLVAAPLLYFRRRNLWLIRIPVALICYIIVIALLCPTKSLGFLEGLSQVRYLCPTIPLWIALGVLTVNEIADARRWLVYPLAILFFGFNIVSANWLIPFRYLEIKPRSTLAAYIGELISPPPDPFTTTANWINENLKAGQNVWVMSGFATYPLMFHAPKVTYAWQLTYPPKPDYVGLPLIHFAGKEAPDYMIGFFTGGKEDVQEMLEQMLPFGFEYRPLPPLNCFGRDLYRPELFLRVFKPITNFDPTTQVIYIFQRIDTAAQQKSADGQSRDPSQRQNHGSRYGFSAR